MNKMVAVGYLVCVLTACSVDGPPGRSYADSKKQAAVDIAVGTEIMTLETAGSAFRKRAQRYFFLIDNDTSDFSCMFTESKESGKVGMELKISSLEPGITYRRRLEELQIILPRAARDFNFDSLASIGMGRLVSTGDLAIAVTNQYRQQFGMRHNIDNYKSVAKFIKESALGVDLDRLFKPYFLQVDQVSIEKLFFATQKELYGSSIIESDSAPVPDKIIDCITRGHPEATAEKHPLAAYIDIGQLTCRVLYHTAAFFCNALAQTPHVRREKFHDGKNICMTN